ncbi:MAG: carboxypeptidase-like regulatory domain-containing protein [Acidobacteriota bacterium]
MFRSSLLKRIVVVIIVALLSNLFPAPDCLAQSRGTLEGQVFDPAGKPVEGAKVTALHENNGNIHSTLTNANGFYTIAFLPPALYTITASLNGYGDSSVRGFRIPLNSTTPLRPPDITLRSLSQPAPASQPRTGENTEIAPLVNNTDAARGGNFSEVQVETLPLGGTTDMRTFDEYALLVAGVSPPPYTPGVRGPGIGFGLGTAGQFSVNGARARSNNFTIDGSDINDPDVGVRRQGFVALVPQSVESIRAFQISTLMWSSELGRNLGSQVNAVSKEGGNLFHAQLYGFFTDSRLNARNFFDYTGGASGGEDSFTRAQTGLVAEGPIIKNRTQFFTSFEHLDVNASSEQHFATPTLSERRFMGRNDITVLKPGPNFFPFEFYRNTVEGVTPIGRNMLSFYPSPNNPGGPYGDNTYTEILPSDGDGAIFSFKVTHQFSPGNNLNARYNFTDDDRALPSVNRAIRSTLDSETRTQNISLIFDSQLTALVSNHARFSYGRTRLELLPHPGSPFIFSKSSLEAVGRIGGGTEIIPSNTGPLGEVLIEPFSPVGVNAFIAPQKRVSNTFQYADSLSWVVRQHSLRFGADIRRVQLNSLLDRNYRPQVVFGNAVLTTGTLSPKSPPDLNDPFVFTPDSVRSLLSGVQLAALGLPSSIFQTISFGAPNSNIGLRFTEYNFFFNDHWRPRPNLVFDYGLRYEFNSVPREVNDRIEDGLTLNDLPAAGSSQADTAARTAAFNASVAAYRRAIGGRTRIYEPDRNNIGPRIGFAWDPWSDGKTAIRAGFGIYYDTILGAVVSQSRNVFPNEIPINVEPGFVGFDVFQLNNPGNLVIRDGAGGRMIAPIPLIRAGSVNQFGGSRADFVALIGELFRQNRLGGGLAFTLPEKNLRTPYIQQWHLTAERVVFKDYFVSAAYVGTRGTKLTRLTTPNLGPNVTPSILFANRFTGFPAQLPDLVLADCRLQPTRTCSIQPRRAEPSLGAYQIFENSAASTYHALQMEMRNRNTRGYQFSLAYTWSHAIDDVSDIFPLAGAPVVAQDSLDLRLERGDANFDVRHKVAASLIWDLPFFRGKTGKRAAALGGWQIASIFQAHTGQPFTLNLPVDANFDGNLTDRPSTTNGLIFFEGHNRQRVALGQGKGVEDFIVFGKNGFVGRNTARADSFINWDAALVKNFRFSEGRSLTFRAEFFNLLNRANFATPIRTLGSPAFGSAVETISPARTVQFALKVNL